MHAQTRPRAILLVEDNEDNRVIYSTMLRVHGFVVHEVAQGESALEMASSLRPEVILMDIGLPSMDGVQVTRLLKANQDTARIPVLALTAHALLAERERAMEAGVDAYLVKPISSEMLVRAVERALPKTYQPLPIVRGDQDQE